MSKSKVHTSKNNGPKAHRNGIKKCRMPNSQRRPGVNQKYLLNLHYSRIGGKSEE